MNQLRIDHPFDIAPFDDTFGPILRPWKIEAVAQPPRIKIDLTEHDDHYAVKSEIPGVRKEDIDVQVDGNLVTVGAEVYTDGVLNLLLPKKAGAASKRLSIG
jgi:HSP20 family protein